MRRITLIIRCGSLVGLLALFIACASLPPAQSANFLLNMRVGYRDANQAGSASLRWRQLGTDYEAQLIAGGELAQIRRVNGNYTLSLGGAPSRPINATSEFLAADIPFQYLEYWINLRPAPNTSAVVKRDPAGRLRSISQDGWQIQYLKWSQGFPRLIRAQKTPYQITLAVLRKKDY